jgi:predicted nucleotide-binding protein
MARRPAKSVPPPAPILNGDQIRRRIEGLERCIEELKAFDPQAVQKRYDVPEVVAIEASIREALGSAFGHGTDRFNLFKDAADLDQGPHTMRIAPAFGRGPMPDYDAQDAIDARRYFAEGKVRSINLLTRAIRALNDDLADLPAAPAEASEHTALRNKVFVVHGHDEAALQAVARFLEKLELEAIVLREQPDAGRTIIEKFEHFAGQVGFAVVLLTPDDVAGKPGEPVTAARARQNVIYELGYFAGKLGRGRACLLRKGSVEIPSDLYGVIYKELDPNNGWKMELVKELKAANLDFDANKAWS